MQRICFFIGNRDAPPELYEDLLRAAEWAITQEKVTLFVTGGRGRFDAMAAQAVQALRVCYPQVRLCLLLAYHPAERPVQLPRGYDESLYPLEKPVPARWAIARVNRHMISNCNVCIGYAPFPGNAQKILQYAHRRAGKSHMICIDLYEEHASR